MISVTQSDRDAARMMRRTFGYAPPPPFAGLIIRRGGEIVGFVVAHGGTTHDIEVTVAGRGCWSIAVMRSVARWLFGKYSRVTARTKPDNAAALKALKTLGFTLEGRVRGFYGDADALLFGLLRGECRLIGRA